MIKLQDIAKINAKNRSSPKHQIQIVTRLVTSSTVIGNTIRLKENLKKLLLASLSTYNNRSAGKIVFGHYVFFALCKA